MSKTPEISVIACHHKGDFVFDFVQSVKNTAEFKSQACEIIIITSDVKLANSGIKDCTVYYSEGMPAEKRNIGARMARAPILGFFDDDVEIDSDCLIHFINFIAFSPMGSIAFGKLHKADEQTRFDEAGGFLTSTGFIWSRAGQNIEDTGQYNHPQRILAGKSASCAVPKFIFDRVGGFDEDFGILGEETDLAWRIWLAGGEVWWLPTARGIHYFNTKRKPAKDYYTSKRVHYNGCRNYLTMLLKNLGKEHLWIVPLHLVIWLIAGFAMIITGKVGQGMNILSGIGYLLTNIPKILKKRGKIQKNRRIDEHHLWPLIHRKAPRGYYTQRFTRYLRIGLHG